MPTFPCSPSAVLPTLVPCVPELVPCCPLDSTLLAAVIDTDPSLSNAGEGVLPRPAFASVRFLDVAHTIATCTPSF